MKSIRILLTIMFLSSASWLMAQDMNAAGEAFNKGISMQEQENYPAAIQAYENARDIASKLGDEGADLKMKAEKQLSLSYYNYGKKLYSGKKYGDAINNFIKSADYAAMVNDQVTKDAADTYIAGLKTAIGNSSLKKEDYAKATSLYNEAIKYKPDYAKAYFGLGLVYKKQDNLEKMKESMDQAIKLAGNDEKTIASAKEASGNAFQNAGAVDLQGGAFEKAIENLNKSLEYDSNSSMPYYYLTIAYNGLKKWEDAINAGNKALELATKDKSDIYFEVAKANEGKGDTEAACTDYKNVTTGNNVAAAKYQIEQVLKCK